MRPNEEQLLAIVKLAYETLSRGEGHSLHGILERVGYTKLIPSISRSKLASLLRTRPDVLEQWVSYSQSSRKNGGYWVSPGSFEVGSTASTDDVVTRYGSVHEAVAEFILREVSFWSAAGERASAPKALPTVDELVSGLDHNKQSAVEDAQNRLLLPYGVDALIPRLAEAFRRIKSWRGRNAILFELIRYARKRTEVLELALLGVNDPAYMVRMQSCVMIAYSQREDMIPHLEKTASHKDEKTRRCAEAAIRAIRTKTVLSEIHEED